MNVLGIGGSVHDFSACVVTDDGLVAAVEEERLSRIKHHPLGKVTLDQLRLHCIPYCLEAAGIRLDDVDAVYVNDLLYRGALRGVPSPNTINHHLSHASAAFHLSPYENAAVLVIDGSGSMSGGTAETITWYVGTGSDLTLVRRYEGRVRLKDEGRPFSWSNYDFVEDSIGGFYSFVNEQLGFEQFEEGKMMALAAYGGNEYFDEFREVATIDGSLTFRFDKSARKALGAFISEQLSSCSNADESFKVRADLASAVQSLLEEAVLQQAKALREATEMKRLCVGGGVFMNCVSNYRVLAEAGFDQMFVHGAAGDNGTALGAALHGYITETGVGSVDVPVADAIYTGIEYGDGEIVATLDRYVDVLGSERCADICARTARLLADGNIIAWFQSRSEFGARALGNRSILADPRDGSNRDRINASVKGREWFRPFAPSVLQERQSELYDVGVPVMYMTVSANVRNTWRPRLEAVTHVDGTGRLQSVSSETNPRYHRLIKEFERLTQVPAILNTSFNEHEPIVETPDDAVRCFLGTRMDFLAIGDHLVWKHGSGIAHAGEGR